MSDQVSGPLGGVFIVIGILFFLVGPIMSLFMGDDPTLGDWAASIVMLIIFIGIGLFMWTHQYWWWPTHAEDRVARIREKFDECEEK